MKDESIIAQNVKRWEIKNLVENNINCGTSFINYNKLKRIQKPIAPKKVQKQCYNVSKCLNFSD